MENKEYFQSHYRDVIARSEATKQSPDEMGLLCRDFVPPRNDQKNSIAVLLVNFGGPRNLNEVRPFLFNLFSDPKVLDLPFAFFYRKPLAWLISLLRTFSSKQMYKKTGCSSPQIDITFLQKEELQKLFNKNELQIDVFVGFRYSKPFIEEVLDEIIEKDYKKLVILPLYPQYSYTTTGSVELVVNNWFRKNSTQHFIIKEWYKDNDYIQSFVDLIRHEFNDLDLRSTEIIFSAHSIPYFNIEKGDPYEKQIKETAELIVKELNWKRKWHLSYQSKLGPVRWLEPSTDKIIKEIAKRNPNVNILVVPISFVSEHVETLFEIEILYKEIAEKCGIKKFVRLEALNTNKFLIQALYNQIIGCLENNQVDTKELLLIRR